MNNNERGPATFTGRMPKYLSPTGLSKWLDSEDDYFLDYIAQDRPERMAQTNAMSVGSAFDAFVKAEIAGKLGIKGYDRASLFEEQVESHNRDFAWGAGERCMAAYVDSGALAGLMQLIRLASSDVQMEVSLVKQIEGVPLLGKPDLFFWVGKGSERVPVIIDWKVNGYCSKSGASPKPGFKSIRPAPDFTGRAVVGSHKDYVPTVTHGVEHNCGSWFEDVDISWARQTSTYGWILGAEVGAPLVLGIDQLACGPKGIRCVEHRGLASRAFQRSTMDGYVELWGRVKSGHYFRGTREESDLKVLSMDSSHEERLIPSFGDSAPADWRSHSAW